MHAEELHGSKLLETQALLEATITQLAETARSSNPAEIPRLTGQPSPQTLAHYKDRNFPVIFTNAVDNWPAHRNWSSKYFEEVMGGDPVTVAITPHGNADSITDGLFAMPCQETKTMSQMLNWLKNPIGNVQYLQLQNGSLHLEFQKLAKDVDPYGPAWARAVFTPSNDSEERFRTTSHSVDRAVEIDGIGKVNPEAEPACLGNIWIGNHLSKTSLHHDPYENIYVQIRGCKQFTLYPPTEYHWLYEGRYKPAQYAFDSEGQLVLRPLAAEDGDREEPSSDVPWLSGPAEPTGSKRMAQGMQVTLRAGETLYLPALWFHAVEQIDDEEGLCVAVNYWYDLDYTSALWQNWKFMRKISMLAHGRLDECEQELHDEEDL